jgi:hypothetical protein
MARSKDEMKREYNQRHAISNADQFEQAIGTDLNGGASDEGINSPDRKAKGLKRATNASSTGTIYDAGSVGELYRGEREYGREDEPSSGGSYQTAQQYGSDARRDEGETIIDLPQDRIINVAQQQQKKRTTRAKPQPEKKQEVRAVVVDVLKGPDIEVTRKRLRAAFIGMFKAFDDWINLTVRETPPQPLVIWTAIDDSDIDTLVEARISHAQHSVVEARIVKGIISVYEQFASGFITVPRMYQTYMAYHIYGFELPGSSIFPSRRRQQRAQQQQRSTLRVEDNGQQPQSQTGQ